MLDFDRLDSLLGEEHDEKGERIDVQLRETANDLNNNIPAQVDRLLQRLSSTVSKQLQCETIKELSSYPTEALRILPALVDVLEHRTDDAIVFMTLGTMKVLLTSPSATSTECVRHTRGLVPILMRTLLNNIPESQTNPQPQTQTTATSTTTTGGGGPTGSVSPQPQTQQLQSQPPQSSHQREQQRTMISVSVLSIVLFIIQDASMRPFIAQWMSGSVPSDCQMFQRQGDDSVYSAISFVEDVCVILGSKYTPYAVNIISLITGYDEASRSMCSNRIPHLLLQYASNIGDATVPGIALVKVSAVACARVVLRNADYIERFVMDGGAQLACVMLVTAKKIFMAQASTKRLSATEHLLLDTSLGMLLDVIAGVKRLCGGVNPGMTEATSQTSQTTSTATTVTETVENTVVVEVQPSTPTPDEKVAGTMSSLCCDKLLISTLGHTFTASIAQDSSRLLSGRCLLALLTDPSSGVEAKVRMTQVRFNDGGAATTLIQRILHTYSLTADAAVQKLVLEILAEFSSGFKSGVEALVDGGKPLTKIPEAVRVEKGKLFRLGLKNLTSAFSFRKKAVDKQGVGDGETSPVSPSTSTTTTNTTNTTTAEPTSRESEPSAVTDKIEPMTEGEPAGVLLLKLSMFVGQMPDESVGFLCKIFANVIAEKPSATKLLEGKAPETTPAIVLANELARGKECSEVTTRLAALLSCVTLWAVGDKSVAEAVNTWCPETIRLLAKLLSEPQTNEHQTTGETKGEEGSHVDITVALRYLSAVALGCIIFFDQQLNAGVEGEEYDALCAAIKRALLVVPTDISSLHLPQPVQSLVNTAVSATQEMGGIIAVCAQIEPLRTRQEELKARLAERAEAQQFNTNRIAGLMEAQQELAEFALALITKLDGQNREREGEGYRQPTSPGELWDTLGVQPPGQKAAGLLSQHLNATFTWKV